MEKRSAKILEMVGQRPGVSIPDMLRAIADAIDAGEITPVGGTVVLRGGAHNLAEVYGMGISKTLADSMMDFRLGEMKLMRIPQQILLNQIEI